MNLPSDSRPELAPELSIYRDHTLALLRRYFCMSVEVGRLPALLGRECFRTNQQDYHVHSFENMVLFVIDVERCLDRLRPFDKELIARVVLQEYTEEEAARMLHCCRRTITRRFPEVLDFLTETFLSQGMLDITQRVRRSSPAGSKPAARRRKRIPRRPPGEAGQPTAAASPGLPGRQPSAAKSQGETELVKPTKMTFYAQADESKPDKFVPDVAHLPLPVCYAEFVS